MKRVQSNERVFARIFRQDKEEPVTAYFDHLECRKIKINMERYQKDKYTNSFKVNLESEEATHNNY